MQKSIEQRRRNADTNLRMLPTINGQQTASIPARVTPILPPSLPIPQLQLSSDLTPSAAAHALLLPAPPLLPAAPEDMQVCVRTPRAERVTTSCSECRRRKQKCDQGRPCGNCVKRYPQPPCEYKQNKNPAVPREPAFKVVLPAQDYDYARFSGIRSPMLPPAHARRRQARQNTQPSTSHDVAFPTSTSHLSPPLRPPPLLSTPQPVPSQAYFIADPLAEQRRQQQHFQQQQQHQNQQQQQWDLFTAAAAAASNAVLGSGGESILGRWQGVDVMTADNYTEDLPMAGHDNTGSGMTAFFGAGPTPAFGATFPPTAFPDGNFQPSDGCSHSVSGGNDANNDSMFLPGLDHAAIVHHDVLSDAFQLLQARRKIPDELLIGGCEAGISTANMDDFYAWLRILTWTAPGQYRDGDCGGSGRSRSRNGSLSSTSSGKSGSSRAQAVPVTPGNGPGTNLFQITGPAADLAHLPLEATRLNADLVRIYVKLISRFKSCLDGNPDPSNPYTRVYVPYCLQTPLLAQVAIYTSACFLHETGHLDKMVAVTHKGRAIDMLNAQLQGSRRHAFGEDDTRSVPTSDDAITAIIQLVMDEWYWGQTRNLHTHLRGLREMIRLRGGLRNLGMNGLISKLAMVSDLAIALSLEMAPVLQGNSYTRANSGGTSLFDYEDLTQTPFRIAHNTPLVAGQPSFAHCAEPLNIHPTTASILDDMRFLITTVLALPPNPTAKDLQKVQTTAEWIHNRIQLLPEDSPEISDNDNKGIDDIGAVDSAMHVHNDGETLSNKTGIPMERRPSIILSQVEPVYETGSTHNASFLGNSQQHHQPQWQQRQLSASPRSNAGRGHSVSPLRKQPSPTPPGSADSSLLSTSMSANNRSGLPSSEFSSRRGSAQWPQATFGPSAQPSSPEPSLVLDPLYQTVRQTALIYARAVLQRRTFSQVVEPHEFVQLWTATWRVSLTAWKGLLGVFMWVTLSIVASARETPHDLFVKSMLSICTVQMSLESWEVAAGALKAAVRLSTWLGGGREGLESTGSQMKGADSAQSVRAQQPRQYGVSAAGGASGVAGSTTTERLELRDSGATLPGWNS